MLERAASNGDDISFEDFYFIMTKKTFAWMYHIATRNYCLSKNFKLTHFCNFQSLSA
jgi:hypothetical protein